MKSKRTRWDLGGRCGLNLVLFNLQMFRLIRPCVSFYVSVSCSWDIKTKSVKLTPNSCLHRDQEDSSLKLDD